MEEEKERNRERERERERRAFPAPSVRITNSPTFPIPLNFPRNCMGIKKRCSIACQLKARVTVIRYFRLQYRQWGQELDAGRVPEGLQAMLEELGSLKREKVAN